MKVLSTSEQRTLTTLANLFYEVVPLKMRTYCHLNAEISKTVLENFGIRANVVVMSPVVV